MNRFSSALLFSLFILAAAALPACTATALDDDACGESCPDADAADDDATSAKQPGLQPTGIVVPQNPKGPGGGE